MILKRGENLMNWHDGPHLRDRSLAKKARVQLQADDAGNYKKEKKSL